MQKTYYSAHRFRELLLISAIFTFTCNVKADTGEDLLKFVVEQNEASREKIQSYSYDLETEWKTKNDFVFSGKAQVKRKGDSLWLKYNRTAFNETANKVQEFEIRMVVNDNYAVHWPMAPSPIAYRYDFTSFDNMPSEIKTRIAVNAPPEILSYCFGLKNRAFSEMKMHPGVIKWDAIETKDSNNRTVYHVRRLRVKEDGSIRLITQLVVDPEKGFLATESITFQRMTDDILSHKLTQVEKVSDKLWFPVSFSEKEFESIRDPNETPALRTWCKAQFKNVKVNEDFPDGQFEIEALNLKQDMPNITVLRRGLDGSKVPYMYYEGKLLPEDAIARVKFAGDSVDSVLTDKEISPDSKSDPSTELQNKPPDVTSVQKKRTIQNENRNQTAIIITLTILFAILIVLTILIYRFRQKNDR